MLNCSVIQVPTGLILRGISFTVPIPHSPFRLGMFLYAIVVLHNFVDFSGEGIMTAGAGRPCKKIRSRHKHTVIS